MRQYGKDDFAVVPIRGLELVQSSFVKYRNSENTIAKLLVHSSSGRIPLCKRFQLIERGYALVLKDGEEECPLNDYFARLNVSLECPAAGDKSAREEGKENRVPETSSEAKRESTTKQRSKAPNQRHCGKKTKCAKGDGGKGDYGQHGYGNAKAMQES